MTVVSRDELIKYRREWAGNRVVGFTSGTFDLLHVGHLELLEIAKRECDLLLVGVNSDLSVQRYKSPLRPIQSEDNRARMIAALRVVDYVFIFDELNNQENIRLLTPTIYFKGGDYSLEQLSSKSLVEEYGGQVKLISLVPGESTSALIKKIVGLQTIAASPRNVSTPPRPAAFLDRDGTLIRLVDYLSDPEQVEILPTVIEGLKLLVDRGFLLIMVTNQQGIGLGFNSESQFYKVILKLFSLISPYGILFDKVYFCPSSKGDNDPCRKPGIGMFQRAVAELPIDVSRSIMIGDSWDDVEFGLRAGLATGLVLTGKVDLVEPDLEKTLPNVVGHCFIRVVTELIGEV